MLPRELCSVTWERNFAKIRECGIVICAYRVDNVAACMECDVNRSDIKSMFLAAVPPGGISVAS
jgi:hypothetical protein